MKQRIFAVLLVLALLVTVGAVAVFAEETVACPVHENCTATWSDWTYGATDVITTGGHYNLTASITDLNSQIKIGDTDTPVDVVLNLNGFSLTSSVRVFYLVPGSSLTIMDSAETKGVITGGSTSSGGVIYVESGTEEAHTGLNLYDITVTSTSTATTGNGGAIYASNYVDIGIHGATINGGSAKYGGAIYIGNNGTITMDSGLITGGYAGRGGNIWLGGSTLNISGGTISNGEYNKAVDTSYGGGNIHMNSSSSKVNISGTALITGGTGTSSTADANRGGGNILVQGTLTMTGGTISDGSTNASGGNVLVRGTFNMSGGTISGGTKTGTASSTVGGGNIAVRTDAGALNISGGSIIDGDIAIVRTNDQASTFTLSGAPVIENINFLTTVDYRLTLGALEDGATVGISGKDMGAAFTVANESAADYAEYFYGATVRATAVASENVLSLQANNYCEACGTDATWVSWAGASIADTTDGDHFYLVNNIMASGGRVLMGTTDTVQEFCVDFNGYSIHKGLNVRNIYVRPGTTLNLMNTAPRVSELTSQMTTGRGGVIFTEKSDNNGCTVNLYDGIKFENVYDGTLSLNSTVYVSASCTLNMHGSTIVGHANDAEEGAVYVGGIFNMDGGHVIGAAAVTGGAIRIDNAAAQLNISGDAVIDGAAATDGGAIYASAGQVNISGGTINGSTVSGNGGAIYADGASTSVSVNGGTINGATAEYGGGGAIAVRNGAALTVSGTALIDGGTAKLGGAIYVADADSSFTMTGGTVKNGKTAIGETSYYGGNLYLSGTGVHTISGGKIMDGTAYANGGNIFHHQSAGNLTISGDAEISGGMVTYNKVTDGVLTSTPRDSTNTNYGGGNIYVRGTTTISGNAQIIASEDAVTNCGGNIYVRGTLNVEGGTISGGKATHQGDCIAVRNAATAVNISGGTVDGIAVIRSDANDGSTITVSGAPTVGYIDVVSYTTDTAYDITLGELTANADITVIATQDEPFTVANENAQAILDAGYIKSGVAGLVVSVADNCLVLAEAPVICPHCGYQGEWTSWVGGALKTADVDGGHYILTQNVTTGGQIAIGANAGTDTEAVVVEVCVNLNGYSITKGGRVFAVYAGSTLNLVNTAETESVLTGAYTADNGGVINLTGASNLTLNDNVKLCSTAANFSHEGGVVNVGNGTFVMDGGTLMGQHANYGGAVYANGGSFTMNDGTINGGIASVEGGSVYVKDATFTMNGGIITGGQVARDDTSNVRGGNLAINGGVATISGQVLNGTAVNGNGGNIYLINGAELTITETAVISGGTSTRTVAAANGGGNIYAAGSVTVEVTEGEETVQVVVPTTVHVNGLVSNGTATSVGGNILAYNGAVVNVAGKANVVDGTSAENVGCELYSNGATLNVADLGAAWSGLISISDMNELPNGNMGATLVHYMADRAYQIWYNTIDEVIANDTEDNNWIMMWDNTTLELTEDGHIVDINGFEVTVNGNATCFDSANNDYSTYGKATLNVAPATHVFAPNGNLYITVKEAEGQYSFHRLRMTFENISLRPGAAGIYYSASWNCDDVLAGNFEGLDYTNAPKVLGYGIALKKNEAPTAESFTNGDKFAYTFFDNIEGASADYLCNNKGVERNSCLLHNIVNGTNGADTNKSNAQVQIYVSPYIMITNYLGEQEYILGDVYGNSMQGIVEYFVSTTAAMEDGAAKTKLLNGLTTFYNTWCADETYGLNGFFTGLEELVAPAETPAE